MLPLSSHRLAADHRAGYIDPVGERIDSLPFEGWVGHTFDHPAPGPEWYFDLDAPFWAGPASLTVAYVTRLFEDPCPMLAGYSDEQLKQGFWYLLSNGLSDYMCALTDVSVPMTDRVRCVRSFVPVFKNLFAMRCTPHLSHLDEPGAGPLNLACYMWWDIIPFGVTPTDASDRELGEAALGAMADILSIDRVACQESALHGLGHWQRRWPTEVARIIDEFLARTANARAELLAYARSARGGCVL